MIRTRDLPPVAVVGPGAVGGVLAAALALRARRRVLVIGRSAAWLALARRSGLRVRRGSRVLNLTRRHARFLTTPPAGPPRAPAAPCEAVFLCVKSGDLPRALASARRLAGPETPVVALQNGLAHGPRVRAAFGPSRAVLGTVFYASERVGPAAIAWHGGREVRLGATPANARAAAKALGLLRAAGFDARLERDGERLLWTKAVCNAGLNALGALTRRRNGVLARPGPLRELLARALREGAAAARASGHPVYAALAERRVLATCRAWPAQRNSMLQDLESGRPTEAKAILGPLVAAARRGGVEAPVLRALYRFVRGLERELVG